MGLLQRSMYLLDCIARVNRRSPASSTPQPATHRLSPPPPLLVDSAQGLKPWAFFLGVPLIIAAPLETAFAHCTMNAPRTAKTRAPTADDYLKKILTARVYDVAIESALEPARNLSRRLGNHVLLLSLIHI